jgi:hypothetical protein
MNDVVSKLFSQEEIRLGPTPEIQIGRVFQDHSVIKIPAIGVITELRPFDWASLGMFGHARKSKTRSSTVFEAGLTSFDKPLSGLDGTRTYPVRNCKSTYCSRK